MLKKQFCADIRHVPVALVITLLWLTAAATRSAQAQSYTVLHAFANVPDGGNPYPIIRDADGTLYGTTEWGGIVCAPKYTCGTVYKVDDAGAEAVLYRFQGGNDGANPVAALVMDAAGNLYGTTQGNGAIGAFSTVFKIDSSGSETVLHVFDSSFNVCCQDSPLALDAAGNLYGMSPYAGESGCGYDGLGCGSLYELTRARKLKVLHIFKGPDGTQPEGGLVRDAKGNLYGTALLGGNQSCYSPAGHTGEPEGCGTVFKLGSNGTFKVLHTFEGHADGSAPLGLIAGSDGNLYGIASYGGDTKCIEDNYGCGTIFKVDASGKFTVLYRFTKAIAQPSFATHLLSDSEGNLYGVNQTGGANFSGFLFKLDPSGKFTIFYSFPSTSQVQDGSHPMGVARDSAGNFYGSMLEDGQPECGPPNSGEGCGTVFKITF